MKTLIQTLFFFLLVTQICFAQWYQQNSGASEKLNSVHFEDANKGWAVGDSGTILYTTNGGQEWLTQASGTILNLNDVVFSDLNTGTAVGNYGTIRRTTDGGTTWTSQSSNTTFDLNGVSFTDANNGTTVGSDIIDTSYVGIILRTTNGGTTWAQQTFDPQECLLDVSLIDANNGFIVGGHRRQEAGRVWVFNIILRTTDGGNTWTSQTIGEWPINLYGVSFSNVNTGTIVGDASQASKHLSKSNFDKTIYGEGIFRTTNAGEDWVPQNILNSLFAVCFTDANNGTAVGWQWDGNYYGVIFRTIDGGTTWIEQSSGTSSWLYGVSFTDANNGTVVGDNGTILHTTNGGVPVELTSFTATTNGEEVILNWSTATELNNQGFEIERASSKTSPRQEDWVKIGFVPGFGTTTEPKSYSYSDQSVNTGTNYYRLKQIDYDGRYEYSDVVEIDFRAFNSYLLEQNFPNPFNPLTTIGFGIQNKSNVKITVLNAIGEEVAEVLNEEREAGFHQVEFNAANLPSGVYFYQLKAGEFVSTKKMLLLK